MTKRAASGPFGTFCHHVVTKRATVTKRAGSASNLIRFVTLMTKRAGSASNLIRFVTLMTKRAGSASNLIRFVTLMTKRAVVTKRAATACVPCGPRRSLIYACE